MTTKFQKRSRSELSVVKLKDSLLVLEQKLADLIDQLVSRVWMYPGTRRFWLDISISWST